MKFFKKYHKWLGVIFAIFFLLFAVSGIVLNHRELVSGIDLSRSVLPNEYSYKNWNNAAVKGTQKINHDSILIYGNIGIWLTDNNFKKFSDFNKGLPKGIDNKKTCKIFKSKNGHLFAGNFFGLYKYNFIKQEWQNIKLPIHEKRIVDITEIGDTLFVLSRSQLLKTADYKSFTVSHLPKPENYDNKISLFKTLWIIHSGEIFGTIGKLIVDLIGIIFIFLTITGLIYFINIYRIKSKKKKKIDVLKSKNVNKWNLKWHNKIGWVTIIFLIITTTTGMFLRPPLLIPIANAKVSKIPFTELDSPNPWFDKLRRIIYDDELDRYVIATLDGMYYSDDNFTSKLKKYTVQPPASVMGVNVFKKIRSNTYLIGSFEGLFVWNSKTGIITNHITKQLYIKPVVKGPPIGQHLVTGMSADYYNNEIYFLYNSGALSNNKSQLFIPMPTQIQTQPISLWHIALELHTGRIYNFIIGDFYILVVPIFGFITLFILISGFIVWYKKYRKLLQNP